MDGFHDLGGTQGYGRIPHVVNSQSYKPVFKEDWEHLGYALQFVGIALHEKFNVDEIRHAVERIDARQHPATSYYERYIIATATLLVEKGVITRAELDEALGAPFKLANPPHADGRAAITGRPMFEVGDRVIVRNDYVSGHVRCPAYCRGKQGVILHRTKQAWPLPDAFGHGDASAAHQPTYHVQFSARELWGETANTDYVVVDLFETYLDQLPQGTKVTA